MALQKIVYSVSQLHFKEKLRIRRQEIMAEKDTNKKLSSYVDDILFVVSKGYLILDNQERILLKDILYLGRNPKFTTVSSQDKVKKSPIGFSTLVEKLPPNFIQCNADQIVNIDWVKKITEDRIILPHENLILSIDYKKFFNL